MNGLRIASFVGLAAGLVILVAGGSMGSTIYGGTCSVNLSPCHPAPPPEDVLGGYLFYSGAVAVIISLVVFVFSLTRQPAVIV